MALKTKESNESKESVSSTSTFVLPAEAASWLDTTLHAGNLILTTLTQAAAASPEPFLKAAAGTALVILSTVQVRLRCIHGGRCVTLHERIGSEGE
jgi:hypothetical protein